jgi:hypothetical protein
MNIPGIPGGERFVTFFTTASQCPGKEAESGSSKETLDSTICGGIMGAPYNMEYNFLFISYI